ncbi:MAG: hypothetical protein AAGF93_08490 [Cyanobacteria bacterium P01_H01_bin.105]
MNYTITESQKEKIIDALRFAADTGNARAAHEWKRLADYLEVLEPGKPIANKVVKSSS